MKKAVCIHGHFYQPPRENPWLEAVEVQDSAHPFHDWNQRITVECYAPNGAARLVDGQGRIVEIRNNYARLSFNFGPTLLDWIERHSPEEYRRIIEADHDSRARNGGHGNAMAQPYNHMIMPLAGPRDRETQILWGLRDFERHFGRAPEGMWLPETAVNLDVLELLAAAGIRFTVLAPKQARRVRPIGRTAWTELDGGIDTTRPYACRLPHGRSIALFFYNPQIAHDIAFGHLLANGENFGRRLIGAFDPRCTEPQLVHTATDGESYGHHWRHGDMALAYALETIERDPDVVLTNYAHFLAEHPPEMEVEIHENTSWSCAHGVERWRSDCGCKLDPGRNWQQIWRAGLRDALDWLRAQLDPLFERAAGAFVHDPWAARNDYIAVIADRSAENVNAFLDRHRSATLTAAAEVELLRLLEMQRHGMLMYTSCGWFFDDISSLEPVQNLKYAARAIQLGGELGPKLEEEFLSRLACARSNIELFGDGAGVYRKIVRPAMASLDRVAAHAAMEGALERRLEEGDRFCYRIFPRAFSQKEFNGTSLTVGRLEAQSLVTRESRDITFTVLACGDHNLQCSARPTAETPNATLLADTLLASYEQGNLTELIRTIDRHFDARHFTLQDLFLESRRKILTAILQERMDRYDDLCQKMFEENLRFMDFAREADVPIPHTFLVAAEEVLARRLEEAIEELRRIGRSESLAEVLNRAQRWRVPLPLDDFEPELRAHLNGLLDQLVASPGEAMARPVASFVSEVKAHHLPLHFWQAQNRFNEFMKRQAPDLTRNGPAAAATLEAFLRLGQALGFAEGALIEAAKAAV